MKTSLFVVVILVLGTHGFCAERAYDPNINTWSVVTPPPESDKEAWQAFWGFTDDIRTQLRIWEQIWVVRRENGRVLAYLKGDYKPKPGETPSFDTTMELPQGRRQASVSSKVDDGWIAGYNMGEFGAAVYWFNETGTQKYKLSDYHIHDFLLDGKRFFAVQGLDHGISRGSMVELRKEGGKWVCEEFLRLPQSGEAIARIAPGDYVVVTSSMLLRVNLKEEKSVLVPKTHWIGASSVTVTDDGFVCVGTRRFVARYKLGSDPQTVEYLIPDESWLNTDKEK